MYYKHVPLINQVCFTTQTDDMICKFLDYQQENDAQCIDLDTEKIDRGSQLCHVNCENEIELESCAFSNQTCSSNKPSVFCGPHFCCMNVCCKQNSIVWGVSDSIDVL
jgi:hypothetical protein